MEHNDILGRKFVKPHRLANRLTREVHECLGLDQDHFFPSQEAFADLRLKLGLPRAKPMIRRNLIKRHKANVMTVLRIFRAGVSKAYKDLHGVALSLGRVGSILKA